MATPTDKMGFEGLMYYGANGSTASTLLENVREANYNVENNTGDTTVRGDSSAPPIETGRTTRRVVSIDFTMINDSTDTALEALRVACTDGNAVALRMKDASAGKGFDGDVTLSVQQGEPIDGEQTLQFTATPTRSYGRAPSLYV